MKKRAFKSAFTEMALVPVSIYKKFLLTLDKLTADEIQEINRSEDPEESEFRESRVGQTTNTGIFDGNDDASLNLNGDLSSSDTAIQSDMTPSTGAATSAMTDGILKIDNSTQTQEMPAAIQALQASDYGMSKADNSSQTWQISSATKETQTPVKHHVDREVQTAPKVSEKQNQPLTKHTAKEFGAFTPVLSSDDESMSDPEEVVHPDIKFKIYPCNECGEAFASQYSLNRHISTMHTKSSAVAGQKRKRGRPSTRKGINSISSFADEGSDNVKAPQVQRRNLPRSATMAGKKRKKTTVSGGISGVPDFTAATAFGKKNSKIQKTNNEFQLYI